AKVEVLTQMDGFLSQERRALVEEKLNVLVHAFWAMFFFTCLKYNKYFMLGIHKYVYKYIFMHTLFIVYGQKSGDEVAFKFIAGVVTAAQRVSFERQVYLTSRGNSLIRFQETNTDSMVFAVFFLGSQLQRSLRRLCQFMNIQICYESDSEIPREVLLEQAKNERAEDKRAHSATRNLLMQLLRDVAEKLKDWKLTLAQEQGIRITMNRFRSHQGNSVLRAEGWCPSDQKERIQQILEGVVRDKGVGQGFMSELSPKHRQPPTYFETNELTAAFQQIVDTYGVPRYKEFNPAIPTIITFPFLFGVMYGDIFHGSCLFCLHRRCL
ncbi:vacuolar proton ATPase 100-kDa subunit, partial [Reticulomyxa filosa]